MTCFYGFGGFIFGFVFPISLGLYSCSKKNHKLADFSLKVLFFWLLANQLFGSLLKWVFEFISPSFWSLVYTAYPVALLIPRTNLLKLFDNYLVSFFNSGSLNLVKNKLKKVCVVSRKALSTGLTKLQKVMSS